jgi:DtxR family Mn-dependent transcriptional regulator
VAEVRDATHDTLTGAVEAEPHTLGSQRDLHVTPQTVARGTQPADRRGDGVAVGVPGDHVGVADEGRHEPVGGAGVERPGLADLEHAAGAHDRDSVGEAERLLLIVGNEDRSSVRFPQDRPDLAAHPHPQGGVEIRERLIEKNEGGLGGERACERHPLLLAARQLMWEPPGLGPQPDQVEHLSHPHLATGAVAHAVSDVLFDRQVREQGVVLEDDADPTPLGRDEVTGRRHRRAVEHDAPGVGPFEAGHEPQRRRLAATTGAEQREHLAFHDREVDLVDGAYDSEVLGKPLQLDDGAHLVRVPLLAMAELHDTTEEYLETILAIEEEGVPPIRARLVERLGVSAPAVSETVNRLVTLGYTELRDDRTIRLTEKGRRLATTVVRRHRLAERLLTDVIGLEWEKVHREAARWEHAISADVEEKLVELLGDPVTCPHGNPIPGSRHKGTVTATVQLAKADPGRVTIARISEKLELNDAGLSLLARARLIPGASATILERKNGEVRVKTAAGEHTVPADVAEQMYVAAPA